MGSGDWFRNGDWSPKIEADFQARLGRTRSQRDQYLVIQAITIESSHPKAALRLIEQYFATKTSDSHDVRALNARARAYLALGDDESAIKAMKQVLEIEGIRPSHKTNVFVEYPYLVATKGIRSEFADAVSVLESRSGDVAFPVIRFKWHAARCLIHRAENQGAHAREQARLALEAAETKDSGFRWHKNLGLVGEDYKATIREIQQIAGTT